MLGNNELRSANESLPESVVMRLMSPYLNKGRNVTTDYFFTSACLARTRALLEENSYAKGNTCSSGNVESPLHETTLLRNGDGATLIVCQGTFNKNVLLLSTLHSTIDMETNRKKLPETVQFYNKTKCGVDILDQMARRYSTRAAGSR